MTATSVGGDKMARRELPHLEATLFAKQLYLCCFKTVKFI